MILDVIGNNRNFARWKHQNIILRRHDFVKNLLLQNETTFLKTRLKKQFYSHYKRYILSIFPQGKDVSKMRLIVILMFSEFSNLSPVTFEANFVISKFRSPHHHFGFGCKLIFGSALRFT